MNTQHTHETWTGKATSSDQGLIYSEQTGRNIAVCYDPKHTALIAATPALFAALVSFIETMDGLPQSDETSLQVWDRYHEAKKAIQQAAEVQA